MKVLRYCTETSKIMIVCSQKGSWAVAIPKSLRATASQISLFAIVLFATCSVYVNSVSSRLEAPEGQALSPIASAASLVLSPKKRFNT